MKSNLAMNRKEKQAVLQRLVTRISTGVLFVKLVYLDNHPKPDVGWIRNIYILLSFYTELLLKAIYVNRKDYSSIEELNIVLTHQRHDLKKIADDIGQEILAHYGIYQIQKISEHAFSFKTDVGDFEVKDFVDIRYDFLTPRVRTLNGDEHEMFDRQIIFINRVVGFLSGPAWD